MLHKKLAVRKLAHFFLENHLGKYFLSSNPISFDGNDDFESCKKVLTDAMNKIENENISYAEKESNL